MCLKKFRWDLSNVLIPQTFKGLNDLCKKEDDVEIHLNKRKKSANESWGKTDGSNSQH